MEDELDDIKTLLKKNISVSQEVLDLQKKMYRSQRIARTIRLAYWGVILLLILGAYYYIQPYMDPLLENFKEIKEIFQTIRGAGTLGV